MADQSLTSGLERATAQVAKFEQVVKKTDVSVNKLANDMLKAFGGKGGPLGSTGGGGTVMMPSTMPNLPPMPSYAGQGWGNAMKNMMFAAAPGAIQMGTSYAMGKLAAMPNVQATMNRATSYYNAGVSMGIGGSGMAGMQAATFSAMRGGITSTGSDAGVAEYLGARGMSYAGNRATYMQTVNSVSNAAKYLNMSNERSVAAIEGLTSGATSRSLLNNLGIYTSDLRSGNVKSQGQIMSEIAQRLTAGRKTASVQQVEDSFRRGNLGASLQGLGLSDDQQQIMKQYLIERAKGNNMDLSSDADMAKLSKAAGINPASAQYQSNTYDAGAMNAAQGNYIKAINDVLPKLASLSEEAGKAAAGIAGYANAQYSFMQGNQAGAGYVAGMTGMAQGGANILSGLLSQGLSMGGGGGGGRGGKPPKGFSKTNNPNVFRNNKTGQFVSAEKVGANGSKYLSTAGKVLKTGAKALGVAGSVLGLGLSIYDTVQQSNEAGQAGLAMKGNTTREQADAAARDRAFGSMWGQAGDYAATGAGIGATIGSFIEPGGGTIVGGLIGGAIGGIAGAFTGFFSSYNAAMQGAGYGGTNSTISNNSPTGSGNKFDLVGLSFIMPANGKISDGFGPRKPPTPGASSFHDGIDIAAPEGTTICASAEGTVTVAGNNGGYGKYIEIRHPNGYITFYGHQSRFAVGVGAKVRQGQLIGYVGNTGTSTGAHLHFGMHDEKGAKVDPMKFIKGGAGAVTTSGGSTGIMGGGGSAPDLAAVIDSRAKTAVASVSAYGGASIGAKGLQATPSSGRMSGPTNSSGNTPQLGIGLSQTNSLTSKSMSIYAPGAPRAKDGDSYVAQDGPVNVHAGEAILTAQQADTWRKALQSGKMGGGGGNHVEINVTIAQASEAEARRFASMVKEMLDHDRTIQRMGSR